jgi:predicted enzyme related to lactoylglutathione lyase
MTEVKRHAPGSFSWAELATTDTKAAKAFYAALFGWSYTDGPMGPGPEDVYTRLQLGGKDVGALYPMMKEQRAQGAPPFWLAYVTVDDADTAAKRTRDFGGKVCADPFDVMDYGRMAIIQDPTGATLAIWQPGTHGGAERVGEPGAICWLELSTSDVEKAGRFYACVFGWTIKPDPEYSEILRAGTPIGGIMPMAQEMRGVPPHWGIYFMVTSCDASAEKAKSLGGTVCFGPKDIEKVGRFAVVQDPQGASFSIFQPA